MRKCAVKYFTILGLLGCHIACSGYLRAVGAQDGGWLGRPFQGRDEVLAKRLEDGKMGIPVWQKLEGQKAPRKGGS